jgi:predicted DNA-binding transcriptional regulator YafY
VRFDVELQARAYALGFGAQLEVVSPPELREAILRLAQATLMFYQA